MGHARRDFSIVFAVLGVLLAIGIPSLKRGQATLGWTCIGLAIIVAAWTAYGLARHRP